METGIIYYSNSQNLGDDIQSYAASRLVSNPVFIERENLNSISKPMKAILSGWFMHHPENFPPSPEIKPLFISFHGKSTIINKKNYHYFKIHEPIGCRDYHTLKLFESIGIDAYFSGCATLSLSSPTNKNEKGKEIIVVDMLRANYTKDYRETIKKNLIPKDWRNKVSYFSHFIEDLPERSIKDRMELVKSVLERYSKAKLVITSLIHCALPCIAMGTPVLFIDFGFKENQNKRDRFEGIIDMMNIYSDIEAPLSKRNFTDTALRILRVHRLLESKVQPIPVSYFEEQISNPPFNTSLVENLKTKIKQFESQS